MRIVYRRRPHRGWPQLPGGIEERFPSPLEVSGRTGGTTISVLSHCLRTETVSSSQSRPWVTCPAGATKTISADLSIHVAMVDRQSAESMVSRAAPSGARLVPGALSAITGPMKERCRAIFFEGVEPVRGESFDK